jgi:RNA methyltransferase, TrmH family
MSKYSDQPFNKSKSAEPATTISPWGTPKAQLNRPERRPEPREPRPERVFRSTVNRSDRPIRPYGRSVDEVRSDESSLAEQATRRTSLAEQATRRTSLAEPATPARSDETANKELRIYGKHAVLGLSRTRVEAIRKVYYHRSAQNQLGDLLRWCAANKVGYREVELDDLSRLAATEHHEGVVADIVRAPKPVLAQLLESLKGKAFVRLVLLDGVSNPHNLGAILRNAAHFGSDAVLMSPGTHTDLSGAAYRVAEGGAEAQPLVHLVNLAAFADIKAAGFTFVAAHTRQAKSLWQQKLPPRCVIVFGAEGAGVSDAMLSHCEVRAAIPGSGKVESLNVAQSVAVFLAEGQRQSSR